MYFLECKWFKSLPDQGVYGILGSVCGRCGLLFSITAPSSSRPPAPPGPLSGLVVITSVDPPRAFRADARATPGKSIVVRVNEPVVKVAIAPVHRAPLRFRFTLKHLLPPRINRRSTLAAAGLVVIARADTHRLAGEYSARSPAVVSVLVIRSPLGAPLCSALTFQHLSPSPIQVHCVAPTRTAPAPPSSFVTLPRLPVAGTCSPARTGPDSSS